MNNNICHSNICHSNICKCKSCIMKKNIVSINHTMLNNICCDQYYSFDIYMNNIKLTESSGQNKNVVIDPNLNTPCGIVFYDNNLWVINSGSSNITRYSLTGEVTYNTPITTAEFPFGIISNSYNNYIINSSSKKEPATLLIASITGAIEAYNEQINSNSTILVINNILKSSYTGIAISEKYLFAANFGFSEFGSVDVFDNNFNPITLPGAFIDPSLPIGYTPFNIVIIDNLIYVIYAIKNPLYSIVGPLLPLSFMGNGIINIFNMNGTFNKRFTSHGTLNMPWSIIKINNISDISYNIFPLKYKYSGPIFMVGNYGDGNINIFDCNGIFLGYLKNCNDRILNMSGLLGMVCISNPKPNIYAVSTSVETKNSLLTLLSNC